MTLHRLPIIRNALAIFIVAMLSFSCSRHGKMQDTLLQAEALIESNPDSTLSLLDNVGNKVPSLSKSEQIHYHIIHVDAKDRLSMNLSCDSIIQDIVNYYDIWGDANVKTKAYYLLGCMFRDRGDDISAINCYNDAMAMADTTSNNCDYRLLERINKQSIQIFERLRIPSLIISSANNLIRLAGIEGNDNLKKEAIYCKHLGYNQGYQGRKEDKDNNESHFFLHTCYFS